MVKQSNNKIQRDSSIISTATKIFNQMFFIGLEQ